MVARPPSTASGRGDGEKRDGEVKILIEEKA